MAASFISQGNLSTSLEKTKDIYRDLLSHVVLSTSHEDMGIKLTALNVIGKDWNR
jgi:hypothetical protein